MKQSEVQYMNIKCDFLINYCILANNNIYKKKNILVNIPCSGTPFI